MTARLRRIAHGVRERFGEHELLLRASAIAFQVLTAIVPFALFVTGAAGGLGLGRVYSDDVAPQIQDAVSLPAFSLIDETVREVLGGRHTFWATGGLALAIWQLSGAVRTVGSTLDTIYEHEDERPWPTRLARSLWIAATVAACLTGAVLVAAVAPLLYGDAGPVLAVLLWLARYAAAAALLILAVGVVVRYSPSQFRPARWVTGGAVLVTVCWIAVTVAFGAYVTAVASFGSIYGVFVSIVVLLAWTYASSLAFVAGIATDAELREQAG